MKTIGDYLDAAKHQRGVESDYGLAKLLGVSKQYISDIRKSRALPGEELMIDIAVAAGVDPTQALMHLCYFRSRHDSKARKVYGDLYGRLKGTSLVVAMALAASIVLGLVKPSPGQAENGSACERTALYIMR